ncbi:FlgO family outer membrane protein [Leptospira venezuelensis]|uniref:FlgO family outer membrane protein n=1 Tax=Leptospira venezuelensis TaxID=1958811 RepID=UPI000A39301E|nr:FlgO family outer membrane protein [Leptospira venezuelensis]
MKTHLKFILVVIGFIFCFNCQKPEDLAVLVAPITYSIAKNAIDQGKRNGEYFIKLKYSNIQKGEGDWPSGEINYEVESAEYPGKVGKIQYILNGSHLATAIVVPPGKNKTQFQVNLVESAIVFGQTQSIESYLNVMAKQLSVSTPKDLKIAVFDFEGIKGERTVLGKRLPESLINYLVNYKLQVLERRSLDSVIKELSFQKTGLTQGSDVRNEIGKFLGADAILTGTLKNDKEEILINARIIRIDTGTVVAAEKIIIPKYLFPQSDFHVF